MVCFNVNGMNEEYKREGLMREMTEGRIDVCGVSETHLVGKGVWKEGENEERLWKGWKGWVAWSGLKEGYKGKKKEGVAVFVSERMQRCVKAYGCISSRIVWCECKIGRDMYYV